MKCNFRHKIITSHGRPLVLWTPNGTYQLVDSQLTLGSVARLTSVLTVVNDGVQSTMENRSHIYHIANAADLPTPGGSAEYRCASLSSEGFIHCCEQQQLVGVVSRYYQDVDDVFLLILDVDQIEAPLILENTVGGSELFPHIYGPINATAIKQRIPFGINSAERMGLQD